jgi:hypothetical protein
VNYRAVIRAGKKEAANNYAGYNLFVLGVMLIIVLAFLYMWKNPEVVGRMLAGKL